MINTVAIVVAILFLAFLCYIAKLVNKTFKDLILKNNELLEASITIRTELNRYKIVEKLDQLEEIGDIQAGTIKQMQAITPMNIDEIKNSVEHTLITSEASKVEIIKSIVELGGGDIKMDAVSPKDGNIITIAFKDFDKAHQKAALKFMLSRLDAIYIKLNTNQKETEHFSDLIQEAIKENKITADSVIIKNYKKTCN